MYEYKEAKVKGRFVVRATYQPMYMGSTADEKISYHETYEQASATMGDHIKKGCSDGIEMLMVVSRKEIKKWIDKP